MSVIDPESGSIEFPEDDPQVVGTTADQLNEATLALEKADYNALADDQLRAVLRAKSALHDVTQDLRQHHHAQRRADRGGDR